MPAHVAIIMDGNGRWASRRGLSRADGHRRGVEALRRTVRAADELGIPYLTVYGFSSENWTRPKAEISDLMGLLKRFIRRDLAELHQSGVRVNIIGVRAGLDPEIARLLSEAESLTRDNTALTLTVAFNYGARDEIARAAQKLAREAVEGKLDPADITAQSLTECMDTAGIPDPDLVIRTSGEQRLSNFLLWQSAYAEFVFIDDPWPDFGLETLQRAVAEYQNRERRFGGLNARTGA